MDNTAYITAGQIRLKQKQINSYLSKLASNGFNQTDLLFIYAVLGDADEYDDYVGKLYTSIPDVAIVGDGSDAEAVAVLTDGIVSDVNVTVPGLGYTTADVVFSGGGGAGAAAHALIGGSGDSITDIVVDYVSLVSRLVTKDNDLDDDFAAL